MNKQEPSKKHSMLDDQEISSTVRIVAETLLERITNEQYPADSRLPSERSLASELGVARNTVREALDLLETRNFINRRAGAGSFVTHNNLGDDSPADDSIIRAVDVSAQTSPLELQVMRGIIEPEMMRLAIVNMSPEDIDKLGEILSRMEAIHTDASHYVRLEEEFHKWVAKGTGNPLLIACYSLIIETRRRNFRNAQQKRQLTPKRIEEYQRRYNTLYNAIALRDIESAVEYVQLHLMEEQRLLVNDL